jgi:hypothetical protein
MKTFAALIAFVGVIALAACGSTGGGDRDGGGGTDNSATQINMYKDGTMKAPYTVAVHENPEAGQYWETTMDANGMKMTTRWQIAKVDGGTAIVEQQNKSEASWGSHNFVIAYEVDLSKGMGEANVNKAWIGKPGEKGEEIAVSEMQTGTGETPQYETSEAPFSDEEFGGGKWSGKVTTTKGDGWESKVWMADNGWFGGMVKMEAGGSATVLTAFGTDAKPLLAWE